MELTKETINGTTIFRLSGRVDGENLTEFDQHLDQFLATPGERLLLDLTGVSYINSSGLRALLVTGKRVQGAGGELALFGLAEQIKHVFEIARFTKIFPIYDSQAAALERATGETA